MLIDLVAKAGLEAWHEADSITGVSHSGAVALLPDASGKGRDLTCSSDHPTFLTNQINGRPAVNFSGTNNPLVCATAIPAPVKHAFVVAAYADAIFPADYPGLLSGVTATTADVLVGNLNSNRFFDFGYGSGYNYYRRGHGFAAGNQAAAFSNQVSIFEVTFSGGFSFDGIQIGRQRDLATRRWKGPFVANLLYSRILSDIERRDIYEYLACKYLLWRRNAAGVNVWPFQPQWGTQMPPTRPVLSSAAVSGVVRSRVKGPAKRSLAAQFETRSLEEFDAATAFWLEHYPNQPFVYRDDAVSPSRDYTMRFAADLNHRANGFRDIDYTIQATEL